MNESDDGMACSLLSDRVGGGEREGRGTDEDGDGTFLFVVETLAERQGR